MPITFKVLSDKYILSKYEKLEVKVSDLPSAILQDTGRNAVLAGELALWCIMGGVYIPQ